MEEKKSKTEKSTKNQKTEIVAADKVERAAKLTEKLKELVEIAKKKKNMLEYQEINDFFQSMELNAEEFEKILDCLEANNIDVLRISDDEDDEEILLDDEEEIEVEKIDLSVPNGVSLSLIHI